RMQVWMLLAFAGKTARRLLEEFLCIFDRLGAANHRDTNDVAKRRLQRSRFEQAEPWVRMVMLVTKLQTWLVKYFRLEFHPKRLSCATSGSAAAFSCEPQTSSGTRVARVTTGGSPNRR